LVFDIQISADLVSQHQQYIFYEHYFVHVVGEEPCV